LNDTRVTVKLYPNPNRGQFSIQVDGRSEAKMLYIINEAGQIVKKLNLDSRQNNITLSGLSPGLYYIQIPDVFGSGKDFSEKVLIMK
jgi:hypothetical protein